MSDPPARHAAEPDQHGKHERSSDRPPPGEDSQPRRPRLSKLTAMVPGRRGRIGFGALAVLLCVALGVAIVTQVRQNDSGDSLDTARPADLLVLLGSLQQREAALNTEVADLQRTLAQLQASGSSDGAAVENAQARLAALSILIGTVAATGPGVTLTIADGPSGVSADAMLDVINELRAAGAEALEVQGASGGQRVAVRVGVDTWVVGAPGALVIDGATVNPPYSILAIGDPPTLAAAMTIPGGATDSIERVGASITVQQAGRVDVTALRQPKPRQYARPVK